ncbi:uncharacterized protein LOC136042073 [Artemia franciscana]|uniref:uncharacterized protein LOC136042073 n=1 Tax=Artemia franciscana TaxID=6661 RepID=UPI0032DBCB1E
MNAFVTISALVAYATAAPATYVSYLSPFAYSAPVVSPLVKTVTYADTPVVSGYTSQIYKPTLGAVPAVALRSGEKTILPYAAPHAVAYTADLRAPVPEGYAPAPEELVQKQKVYAPVRASQKITPQFDVHLTPEVQVRKVPVEVPVAAPYAQPYAVPVPVHPLTYSAPVVTVQKH